MNLLFYFSLIYIFKKKFKTKNNLSKFNEKLGDIITKRKNI